MTFEVEGFKFELVNMSELGITEVTIEHQVPQNRPINTIVAQMEPIYCSAIDGELFSASWRSNAVEIARSRLHDVGVDRVDVVEGQGYEDLVGGWLSTRDRDRCVAILLVSASALRGEAFVAVLHSASTQGSVLSFELLRA